MFQKLKLVNPDLFISNPVAVVGSSSKILKDKNGVKIDSYENVIRFNRSVTKKFETYVGSKTSLRVVNNHVFDNLDISDKGYYLKTLKLKSSILFVGLMKVLGKKKKHPQII